MRFPAAVGVVLLAGLAGCQTLTPAERRALDEQQCRSYGFRPNTDAFAECLQRIDLNRQAEYRFRMAEMDRWNDPLVLYRPIIVRRD